MAHTYGNASTRTSSTATTITTATYTPTSGATVVVLMLWPQGGTNRAGGTPSFAGSSMTQANSTQKAAASPEASVEVWYLVGTPLVASSGTASIPNSGGLTVYYQLASAVAGTNKTSAYDNAAGSNGTSTNPSCGAMTVAANSITFAALSSGLQSWSITPSGTSISDTDIGATGAASQYTTSGGGGSQTMSWTMGSDDWGAVAVSFKEINAYSLPTDVGTYAVTGSAATSSATHVLPTDVGAYTVTGAAADLTVWAPGVPATGFKNFVDGFWAEGVWADGVWAMDVAAELDATPGSYAVTGSSADLVRTGAYQLATDVGTYTVTGSDATFARGLVLDTATGTYTLTGSAAALESTGTLPCARLLLETGDVLLIEAGGFVLLEHSGSCAGALELLTDVGSYLVTGSTADLLRGWVLDGASGSYTLTGTPADLVKTGSYSIDAVPGSYALTGSLADLLLGRSLTATPGSYTVTGSDATFLRGRVVDGSAGSYALTGSAATFARGLVLRTDAGAYVLTGTPADLVKTGSYSMDAVPGSYVLTGSPADLLFGRRLDTVAGSYALTGSAADLRRGWTLETVAGSYVVTGSPADLVKVGSYALTAEPGAYTITGADALLTLSRVLTGEVGAYVLTGTDVEFVSGAMSTEPGIYLISGVEAVLTYSSALPTFTYESILTRRLRRSAAIHEDARWLFHHELQVDLETGVGAVAGQGRDPMVLLRWSDDGGETWSNERAVSAGKLGEFARRAIWRSLGRSRDRVYEVTVSDPVAWHLLAAILKIEPGVH